ICPVVEGQVTLRNLAWEMRVKSLSMANPNAEPDATSRQLIDNFETQIKDLITKEGALLMPGRAEVGPNSLAEVPLRLIGAPLDVTRLELRIRVDGASVKFTGVGPSPALAAAGYRVLHGAADDTNKTLVIERNPGANA